MYSNVEAAELVELFPKDVAEGKVSFEDAAEIRRTLAAAIHGQILSPEQYRAITGDNELTTSAELRAGLVETWRIAFPMETCSADESGSPGPVGSP
jgi:hypothetical protein